MITEPKVRKNINVSIQSKKYTEPINSILNVWEGDGLNISTEVCDSILLADKIAQSPTLLSVMKIYALLEEILELNGANEDSLEEALSKLIIVKGSELTKVLCNKF